MKNSTFSMAAATLMLILSTSCIRSFTSEPCKYAHRDYKKIKSKNKVSGEDLIHWLDQTHTSGPFSKVPYITCYELTKNSDEADRKRLVAAYKTIYTKLIHDRYGQKSESIIYEGGEERIYGTPVNVKTKYSHLYQSVLKSTLSQAKSGEIKAEGENELQELLSFMQSKN